MMKKKICFSIPLAVEVFVLCILTSILGIFLLAYHYEGKIKVATTQWGNYTESSHRFSTLTILAKDYLERPLDRVRVQWEVAISDFDQFLDTEFKGGSQKDFKNILEFLQPAFSELTLLHQKGKDGRPNKTSPKEQRLSVHMTLLLHEGLLLSQKKVRESRSDLQHLQRESRNTQNVAFVGLILLMVMFPAYLLVLFTRTFDRLLKMIESVANNPAQPVDTLDLPTRGGLFILREVHNLYSSFQKMAESVTTSIAEVKSSQEQLSAEVKRFHTVMDAMDALVYVADLDTHEMLFVNKKCQGVTGDYAGRKCWEVMQRGQEGPCTFCSNPLLTDELGESIGQYIWEFQNTKDGIWYECRDEVIEWVDGKMVRLEMAHDITRRKEAEITREQLEHELRHSQKMRAVGTLAGGIAHDFNNILAAIMGYSELIREDLAGNYQAVKDIDNIIHATQRAANLVRQILTFSKNTNYTVKPVSPGPIVAEVLSMLNATLPKTITIQQDIDFNCGKILADPTSVHQVVMNLCTNAVKAMSNQRGTLEVSLKGHRISSFPKLDTQLCTTGHIVELIVKDDGCGMTTEIVNRIFEPYFSTRDQEGGTGLGLAVSQSIVEEHKGKILVSSTVGKGSEFRVLIASYPVDDSETVGHLPDSDLSLKRPTSFHVVVVDDEASIAIVIGRQLQLEGFTTIVKTDPREVLSYLAKPENQADLLITDQTMPEMTGAELVKEILLQRPKLPIIMMTGHSDLISKSKAKEIGIAHFLHKPVTKDTLLKHVNQIFYQKEVS